MVDVTAPTALDSHDYRTRLRRNFASGVALCATSLVLMVLAAVILVLVDAHLSAQQDTLDRYRGRIVAVTGGDDSDSSAGSATVDFTQQGQQREVAVHIDNTASWSAGPATVLVDPHDPGFVTLRGENYFPAGNGLAFWIFTVLGFTALGFGSFAFESRRRYRVLADASWQVVTGYAGPVPKGNSKVHVLFVPDFERGAFWTSTKLLGSGKISASVAIDRLGRLVMRRADGKRLVYASPAECGVVWRPARVTATKRIKDRIELRTGTSGEAHLCRLRTEPLSDAQIETLLGARSVDLLWGPVGSVVVRVEPIGIVGIGSGASVKQHPRRVRGQTAVSSA
jgi:hypothetical protein